MHFLVERSHLCLDVNIMLFLVELLSLFVAICLRLTKNTRPCSAVGNMSGNRCESVCRSRGHEFDPGPVPYFHGD